MKQLTKILLLMLAVAIVGVGMPAAFSIGSGQHQFNQIDPNNPDEFCNKCHLNGDSINAELAASGTGVYTNMKIHSTQHCVDCHAITPGYGSGVAGAKTEHAASIPTCTKCHGGSNAVLGFDVANELSGSTEAHNQFTDDVACVGCHTTVAVSGAISYTYSGGDTRFGLKIGS